MSYFYDYLGDDQDLLVESEEPRPDLLEWAYWREITADEAAAKRPKPAADKPVAPRKTPAKKPAE